jgi:hypothetical protein
MKKIKKKLSSVASSKKYKLTKRDLDTIEEDIQFILLTNKECFNSSGEDWIEWTIFSDDLNNLNRYQKFLMSNFPKSFSYQFYIKQIIKADSLELYVIIENFPIVPDKIREVSKFLYTTTKTRGCQCGQAYVYYIPIDDPLVERMLD